MSETSNDFRNLHFPSEENLPHTNQAANTLKIKHLLIYYMK